VGIVFVKHGSIGLPENYILVELSERSNFSIARPNVINIAQAGTKLNFSYCTKAMLFYISFSRNRRQQSQSGSV